MLNHVSKRGPRSYTDYNLAMTCDVLGLGQGDGISPFRDVDNYSGEGTFAFAVVLLSQSIMEIIWNAMFSQWGVFLSESGYT